MNAFSALFTGEVLAIYLCKMHFAMQSSLRFAARRSQMTYQTQITFLSKTC